MPLPISGKNSNFGAISHRFRDTATYSLKPPIKNCSQTVADGDMVTVGPTIDSLVSSHFAYSEHLTLTFSLKQSLCKMLRNNFINLTLQNSTE